MTEALERLGQRLRELQELRGPDDARWLPTWAAILRGVEEHKADAAALEQRIAARWRKVFGDEEMPDGA